MAPTTQQLTAARYLSQFGVALLKTKRVERSNSVRCRLFRALRETVARHRADIPHASSVSDAVMETSGFDRDEARFRHSVVLILTQMGRSPALIEISASLLRFAQEERDLCVLEKAGGILERQAERQELLTLVGDALRECEAQDRAENFRRELRAI